VPTSLYPNWFANEAMRSTRIEYLENRLEFAHTLAGGLAPPSFIELSYPPEEDTSTTVRSTMNAALRLSSGH
jgi:hypothetical protein